MIIGIPKEVKVREYRVGMVPAGVRQLVDRGHKVLVQNEAGLGSGITDATYQEAGACIIDTAEQVWAEATLIIKVKEPVEQEFGFIRADHIIYTYLHLAAARTLTDRLIESGCIAIGYETIQEENGSLPLLKPMSEVAGRMSIQVGAATLEKERGGKGILLGGVPGVRRGRVTIIGAGVVGLNACKMAVGLGAEVDILDINLDTLNYIDDIFFGRVTTLYSDPETIARSVCKADLVIGAVLIPGARAPKLVPKSLVNQMEPGSVIVDVAVDQGGCIETMKPTTHDNPTFIYEGVVHYGVTNMPGAVSQTSTFALTNTTIGHALSLADMGPEQAVRSNPAIACGVNVYRGAVTCPGVAESLSKTYQPLGTLLGT